MKSLLKTQQEQNRSFSRKKQLENIHIAFTCQINRHVSFSVKFRQLQLQGNVESAIHAHTHWRAAERERERVCVFLFMYLTPFERETKKSTTFFLYILVFVFTEAK